MKYERFETWWNSRSTCVYIVDNVQKRIIWYCVDFRSFVFHTHIVLFANFLYSTAHNMPHAHDWPFSPNFGNFFHVFWSLLGHFDHFLKIYTDFRRETQKRTLWCFVSLSVPKEHSFLISVNLLSSTSRPNQIFHSHNSTQRHEQSLSIQIVH